MAGLSRVSMAFFAASVAFIFTALHVSVNGKLSSVATRRVISGPQLARHSSHSSLSRCIQLSKNPSRSVLPTVRSSAMPDVGEQYEVNLEKPIGISFARGNDGRAYIVKLDPRKGNLDPRMEVGDVMTEISASFGDDVWKAENFGQIMYAIRTRVGGLFFKFEKRDGDMSFLEMDMKNLEFRKERAGGNYGAGTREVQMKNYITSKENERVRNDLFNQGLDDYRNAKYEDGIYKFEDVLGMEPPNYVGDNFARITPMYEVANYNIACCYSKMGNFEAALEALNDCLNSGYEDFDKIRTAEGLAELREAEPEKFRKILDRYDEPVFDPKMVEGFKNFFGIGKK